MKRPNHSNQRSLERPSSRKSDKLKNHRRSYSFLENFTAAIIKIFENFRKHRHTPTDAQPETIRINNQVKKLSSSIQNSSGSNCSSWKSQSSDWCGSSWTESGLIGLGNFTFEEIYEATDHFSDANIIGQGGFGTVYKGRQKNGSLIAVKRFKKRSNDKLVRLEFRNEVCALSKIEHLNLVRLYGHVEYKDEKIIVFEYFGNGTLRDHLDGTRGHGLDIAERLDIAIDLAHAVTYLHTYSDIPVIHRDIKSSNILITENFRAKVADFGFARMLTGDPNATHVLTEVKGTTGYLDPEYLRTYQLTDKSDVYSFGVLLVEMMTGRCPIETKRPERERVTIKWAMQMLREGDIVLAMDPRIRRSPASIMAVEKVLKLAHKCLAHTRRSRPSMRRCAEILWIIRKEYKEMDIPPSPVSAPSHFSANYPDKGAKKSRQTLFGIKDEEKVKYNTA